VHRLIIPIIGVWTLPLVAISWKVNGDLRSVYLHDSTGSAEGREAEASGVGGAITFHSPRFQERWQLNIGVRGIHKLHESNTARHGDSGDLHNLGLVHVDSDDEHIDHITLGIANLNYQHPNLNLIIGNQKLNTPSGDLDDVRLLPNYFQGITATAHLYTLNFKFGYLHAMAGWESQVTHKERFEAMSRASTNENAEEKGVYFSSSHTAFSPKWEGTLWYYHLPSFDIEGQDEGHQGISLETTYIHDNHEVQWQYFRIEYEQEGYFDLGGISYEYKHHKMALAASLNIVGGSQPVTHYWGSVPEYTAMEEFDLGAFSDHGKSNFAGRFSACYCPTSTIALGSAIAHYKGQRGAKWNLEETSIIDLTLEWSPFESFTFNAITEQLYYTTSQRPLEDNHIVRIGAYYTF